MLCHCGRPATTTNGTCGQCWSPPQILWSTVPVPETVETPAERRLRDVVESPTTLGTVTDKELAAIDMGREALELLRVFQHGPSGDAWEEWLENVRALLARAGEES